MSNRFVLPYQTVIDQAGVPLPGALLYFYISGTSTPLNTYSDEGLTTPNSNPVVANAGGQFPNIFLLPQDYKVVLTDDLNNQIWTADPVENAPETASDINYTGSFSGAQVETVQARLTREVWIDDLVPTGNATDYGPYINALSAALPTGGTCFLSPSKNYPILTSCTLPKGVTLQGPYEGIGTSAVASQSANFSQFSAILLSSSASVTFQQSAGIDGCLVYRRGMTFPVADGGSFAGTAFIGAGDDCFLHDSMILGFTQAFTSNNVNRPQIIECHFDNTNNVLIQNSFDTARVTNCHAWPYLTDRSGGTGTFNQRFGTAFKITGSNDWAKFTNCFSYGYDTGFWSDTSDSITFLGCGADNIVLSGFGNGFKVTGSTAASDNQFIGCQAAAQENGFVFLATSNQTPSTMIGCVAWGNINHGVIVGVGSNCPVRILGGTIRDSVNGITVATANALVDIDQVFFNDISGANINVTVVTSKIRLGDNNNFGNTAAGTSAAGVDLGLVTITASGGLLNLPATGNRFIIDGTNNFGSIAGGWAGRLAVLEFDNVLTIGSSTGASNDIYLAGGTNYTSAANGSLTILHNGAQWIEVCRQGASGGGGGSGTVTSAGLSVPAFLSVSGSPITTSGTFAVTLATQTANFVFAGPTSGGAVAPTFRALVAADIPVATSSAFGAVKPDNSTITISAGVITAVTGGAGTITGVTAGTNLSGGGVAGNVTLNVVSNPTFGGGVTVSGGATGLAITGSHTTGIDLSSATLSNGLVFANTQSMTWTLAGGGTAGVYINGTNDLLLGVAGGGSLNSIILEQTTVPVLDNIVNLGSASLGFQSIFGYSATLKNHLTVSGNAGVTLSGAGAGALLNITGSASTGIDMSTSTVSNGIVLKNNTQSIGWYNASHSTTVGFTFDNVNALTMGQGAAAIYLGQTTDPLTDNTFNLGSAILAYANIYAHNALNVVSDRRMKISIQDSDLGLDFINRLHPVSYVKSTGEDRSRHYGLIAQEVGDALHGAEFGGLKHGEIMTLAYEELISPLIRSNQELSQKLNLAIQRIERLEAQNAGTD